MPRNYYVSGSWNCICDSCSIKVKASETKQRWDGLIVCRNCFEMRQPQDFVKARQDKITVPFTRPRPTDAFILVQGVNDPVSIVDVLTTNATYTRNINDFVTVVDVLAKQNSFIYSDIVVADDGSDIYIDPTYFLEDYVESNPLGKVSIFFGKPKSEAINIVDSFSKTYNLSETDSADLLEYILDTYYKQTSDVLSLTDNITLFNRRIQPLSDSTLVSELISFATHYYRTTSDSVNISDSTSVYKTRPVPLSDSVSLTDSSIIASNDTRLDSASVADSGSIFHNSYIDPTYFAQQYVGTITSI